MKWWAASNVTAPNQKLGYYLGIYGLLGVMALISLVVSCWQVVIKQDHCEHSLIGFIQATNNNNGTKIWRAIPQSLARYRPWVSLPYNVKDCH